MKILVAGDRGYIGAVLLPHLQQAGHDVDGLDLGLYEGCDFAGGPANGLTTFRDTRDVTAADVDGYDAVVCLAALSNDPLGELSAATTYSINVDGTVALAQAAKDAGVPRFIFASSCSLYGSAGSDAVGEDADMRPVTPYGESKVMAEKRLSAMADDDFHPTYMRNATAYGASPRLRLDIVVNNLTGIAVTTGRVRLQSDGTPWRPLVHIEDISRVTRVLVEAPIDLIHDEAYNVGREEDNLQIRDIAEMVAMTAVGSVVTYAPDAGPDLRNYRADFSKLHDTFPDLDLRWTVADGVRELVTAYTEHGLTLGEFDSSRFIRLRRVQELMAAGQVDDALRRVVELPEPSGAGDLLVESVGA